DDLAAERRLDIVTFRDWQKIEEAEIAAARHGSPREKFVDIESMIAARGV
ncbi:MAG TPA: pyridine nucleotide-disulfide oxidoreductase, partial [Erythrobacter sp.]|nr:pyridine nucleotide-disulfide oxidoreductase [Erythrobacter sp.]